MNSIISKSLAVFPFLLAPGIVLPGTMRQDKQQEQALRPNILFIIADDASYAHFGANGCRWVNTPGFDRVAKNGVLFTNCYTPNAKCAPSRSCILTGRYSWQLGAAANHIPRFPSDIKVVTEALTENGYDVAFTGKGWEPGVVEPKNGVKRELTGTPYQKKTTEPPTPMIRKTDYAANFVEFLDQSKDGVPWFFWVGFVEPHREYEFGSGERLGGKTKDMIDKVPAFWPDNDRIRTDMLDYAFEIEYLDKQVVRILDELQKRGMLNNTIVMYTSDNGMPFSRSKANNYEMSNHMPLAVMWKKGIANPGRKVTDYVSFVDFAPTFLEASNTDAKKHHFVAPEGRSLFDIFKSSGSGTVTKYRNYTLMGRERHDYGRPGNQGYPIRAIIQDSLLYINNMKPDLWPNGNPETGYSDSDGSPTKTEILKMNREDVNTWYYKLAYAKRPEEELYNLSIDKDCLINLAKNSAYSGQKKVMKDKLYEQLRRQADPRMFGNGDIFDQYPFNQDQAWNFWERVQLGEIIEPWKKMGWLRPTDFETYQEK
ncbi:MAG: sulfatase [Mangrovibacterium sp.]